MEDQPGNLANYVRSKEAEVQRIATIRQDSDFPARTESYRDDADVDYARVLYSSSCRRLQGKMQLFIPKTSVFYRNRLTHSLEVTQIARTLAKRLGLNDHLTVQTCALAHDLGNPPFGHAGEVFLSKCSDSSTFEGNAQTFRILTNVEDRHPSFNGLNLTLRTLLGVVKYFQNKKTNGKKFLYDDDYELVKGWVSKYEISMRTIDCEIMDMSDEITYAAHDLEDALKLKYFTIGELVYEFKQSDFRSAVSRFEFLISEAERFASKADTYETSEEYAICFRKELTSLIVNDLVKDIDLVGEESSRELGYATLGNLARGLKHLTFRAIKRNPDIMEYELLGRRVLQGLYKVYMDQEFNKELVLLPAEYREVNNWERTVLDYIGGMMDSYAFAQYEKYFGKLEGKGIYS
jgi:dGTPase